MATRLNPTNFGYQNFYSSTLTGDITSGTLTIGLATVPTPSSGILVIEPDSTTNREVIVYTSKGASTITCPSDGRGYSGTTAAAHLTGSTVIMAPVDKWFTALASGELSTDPLRTELFYDYVASGCTWSGDSYGSTRNASMTSGVIYINGRRLTVATITARSFTASKDTYIDASDAGDGTATITYSEVLNNAASPSLAANSIRLGIIVTGASNIANVGSVNQGQESKVLPIASSVAYSVVDSLGNMICPRDPLRRVIGGRQNTTSFSTTSGSYVQVTGLSVPVIVPDGRKLKVTIKARSYYCQVATHYAIVSLWDGTVGSGTQLSEAVMMASTGSQEIPLDDVTITTLSAGLHTLNVGFRSNTGGDTSQMSASSVSPLTLVVELI